MYMFVFAAISLIGGIYYLAAPNSVAEKAAKKAGRDVTPKDISKARVGGVVLILMAVVISGAAYYTEFMG